ncbi:uncharacterized protein LOC131230563 [Magnolia sinica]|uniref:uncharacterized protein LOC131230563 n=1 Tax=Magnolia sinica TaxID=86752 RepID=UPI002658C172|nr:uncharacterized protein LOC131230563 [Magnolia sinica]
MKVASQDSVAPENLDLTLPSHGREPPDGRDARVHLPSQIAAEDSPSYACNNWLSEGDCNAKLFHLAASERVRRSTIHEIQLHSGEITPNQALIKEEGVHFMKVVLSATPFASQFGAAVSLLDCIPSLVSAVDNELLLAPPSLDEVRSSVFALSSMGPLGLMGFLWLSTVAAPRTFADFRPISLCNVIYKIFVKIIISRLSSILPKLISAEQGAFIKGRSIAENIALCQEIFTDIGRKVRGGNIAFKLDMEKAYDRIEWSFLKQVLIKFGFCPAWVKLVESCWNSNCRGFSRLVESGLCHPFKLKQGCKQATHLLYADDMVLFLNGGCRSLGAVRSFLSAFQEVSGQKINQRKSAFYYSPKLLVSRIRSIERYLGINNSTSALTYLGVPIAGSRLTLISSVLSSIPIHFLAATIIPKKVLSSLEASFANFFWGWRNECNKVL